MKFWNANNNSLSLLPLRGLAIKRPQKRFGEELIAVASQALNLLHLLPPLVLIRQWNSKLHNRWSLSLWHKENLSSHLARLYSHHLTRHPTLGGARSFQPPSSTFDPLTTTRACHFSGSCCYNRMHVKFARFLLSFGSRGFHFPPHKSVHSLRTCVVSRVVSIPLFISIRQPFSGHRSYVTSFTFLQLNQLCRTR